MNLHAKSILIAILITTIIIDMMGLGLVFPIMPALFFDDIATFGDPLNRSLQNWFYSIALLCWPLGLMIGCPIVGELSDKYGRKAILIIALLVTCISYALSAYAIYSHNYIVFIISRFVSGLSGGAFEVAQATVINISTEEEKSKNLGLIAMAGSFGFVVGPIITALIFTLNISHALPFVFAGILSFINMLFICAAMKKDLPKNPSLVIGVSAIYRTIFFLFVDRRVRIIGVVYLLVQCGWGFYGQGAGLFLDQAYGYNVAKIAMFYGVMGLATVVASLILQPKIFVKFSNCNALIVATIVCGIGFIAVGMIVTEIMQWFIAIILSAAQLICYTALLTMISFVVSDKEQGRAMGAAGAGFGLAWVLNDIMLGHLVSISPSAPISFGGGMYFIAIIIFIFATRVLNKKVEK